MGQISATFERAAHLIGSYLESRVGELGLTQGEAHVLAQVARRGPTAIGALHDEFGHKRSTLTNIIDRLERRGFVRRQLNPDDRRSFVVHPTAAGRSVATRITKALDDLEYELALLVGTGDLDAVDSVARALETIVRKKGG